MSKLVPKPNPDDINSICHAISKLDIALNTGASPTFAGLSLNGVLDMSNYPITNVDFIDLAISNSVAGQEGRIWWNGDDGTVNIGMPGGNVTLQVGQEMILRARNSTGSLIENGKVVRIAGSTGAFPTIELADADDVNNGVTGLATEDIADNSFGYVTVHGMTRDIDTNAYAAGSALFLSDTAGEFTNIPPVNGKRKAFIGLVVVQGSGNGVIWVNPINTPFLSELSGVKITSVADQDVLQYDSSVGNWVNTNRLNELWDIANGSFLETIDFLVTEAGGTVTGSLNQSGSGDLTQRFSDGYSTLDTTPALTINLTAYVGTDAVPKEVFVYILQSAKTVMAASNVGWPATEHIKVANLILRSAATTGTDSGALVNRNWNDHTQGTNNQGHLLHLTERMRQLFSSWRDGVALTIKDAAGAALTTGNSSTAIELVTTEGNIYQVHKQTFPATDMYANANDDVHVINDFTSPYLTTADLVTDITALSDGTAIGTNKYFNLVIWGVQNKTSEEQHMIVNLPTGQYTVQSNAVEDVDGYSIFDIPDAYRGVGFLIARLTFKLIGGSQWTYVALEDLRGKVPISSAGVGVSTTDHSLLANLTADDHTQYHTDARAVTWLAANHETTYTHADIALNTTHRGVVTGNPHNVLATQITDFDTEVANNPAVVLNTAKTSYTDAAAVALNTTHRTSDGKDHSDVVTNNAKISYTDAAAVGLNTTHRGLVAGNPHAVTKSEVGLSAVENTALTTWTGAATITTLGTIATGVWNGTTIAIANGGTGQVTAQAAIDALTAVSGATNEYVLTKDTATGNAVWKVAVGGSATPAGSNKEIQFNSSGSFGAASTFVYDSGKMGLGTASPLTGLHITGANADIVLEDSGAAADNKMLLVRNTAQDLTIRAMTDIGGTQDVYIYMNRTGGNVGIGVSPVTKFTVEGSLTLKEQASASADTAAYGQLWVKTATPNELWFTNDAGDDLDLISPYREGVSSGDPSAYTFYLASPFITDATWRNLDISSYAPVGARAVILNVRVSDSAVNSFFTMKRGGNTNDHNAPVIRTQVAGQRIDDVWIIEMDSSGIIQYRATNTTFTGIDVTISGWI